MGVRAALRNRRTPPQLSNRRLNGTSLGSSSAYILRDGKRKTAIRGEPQEAKFAAEGPHGVNLFALSTADAQLQAAVRLA
jgi:hypothetical protein